jgi:RNA polymerase sigma factor (sigma-70 family)
MVDRQANMVLHGLCKLVEAQAAQLTDGQLLSRFTTDRDEAAFAVLLQRYGRLVYGVCRNVLRHDHDAEDAFQATFLVLARRAGAIRSEQAIGSWLYRIAYRVAMKSRQAAERRRLHESQAAKSTEQRPTGDLGWRELQTILDEELNRLPEKYRAPFVLCCLLGKSKSEAAKDLAWKEGTVSSRLAHSRHLLRARLARRGVLLSALLSGLAVSEQSGASGVPTALLAQTQKAAVAFAIRATAARSMSASAVLAQSVLRESGLAQLRTAAIILTVVSLLGTAIAVALYRPADPISPISPMPEPVDEAPIAAADPGPDALKHMVIRGRVTGSDGKAVPGADVAIVADEVRPAGDRDLAAYDRRKLIATGKTDADGKFQFVTVKPVVRLREERYCLVRVDGQGTTCLRLQSLVAEPPLEVKLEPEQRLRGQLVDSEGRPAGGVTLHFGGVGRGRDVLPAMSEGLAAPACPSPVVTDADGRFVLTGILRRSTVQLRIEDDRYGPHWLAFTADDKDEKDVGTVKLAAPRVLEGTVLADDAFKPLPGATVVIQSFNQGRSTAPGRVIARVDETGRFSAKVYPGDSLSVTAAGAPGTPYLAFYKSAQIPVGTTRHETSLFLPRGKLVRGRVAEIGSGKPVVGARIMYRPMSGENRNGDKGNLLVLWQRLDVASDANGNFELAVLRGRGHLLVRGPDHEFIPMEVGDDELIFGEKGGDRLYYPDALVPINVKATEEPKPVVAVLRRGVTFKGRVETADGKPVANGFLVSRTYLGAGWEQNCEFLPIRDGRFEIPGFDAEQTEPYWLWDHKAFQGAVVKLSARDQGTTVRLAPFGTATMRFVDPKGNVVPNVAPRIDLVIRPGRSRWEPKSTDTPRRMPLDAGFQGIRVDPKTGVVTASSLIPDATYVIETGTGQSSKPFSVSSGGKLQLPDVVIEPSPKAK